MNKIMKTSMGGRLNEKRLAGKTVVLLLRTGNEK